MQRSLYTERLLDTKVFTHGSLYTEKSLQRMVSWKSARQKNPPAPKVPRRGSLAARDTNGQICQTGSFSWGGAFSTEQDAKKCTGLVICTFCRSAQNRPHAPFRSDMAATLAQPRPARPQLSAQLGPIDFQLGSKKAQLGPKSQSEVHMASKNGGIAGPIRNPQTARFRWYLRRFLLSTTLRSKQCSPCCVSIGPNFVWSCRQRCQAGAC